MKFFDSGTNADGIPDGDAITVNLNGKLIASDMLLVRGPEARNSPPKEGEPNTFVLDLQPGITNKLTIIATSAGIVPFTTVGWRFLDKSFRDSTPALGGEAIQLGKTTGFNFAYPQVANASASQHPEIAQHMREAWAAGKTRFCTKESNKDIILNGISNAKRKDDRRTDSLKKFNNGNTVPGFDRDEYPPAVCIENGGNADVKATNLNQNRAAGNLLKQGIEQGYFGDYDTFELIIDP